MYYDIHCHFEYFDNPKEIIDRALAKDVKLMINNGLNPESNRKVLEICKKFPKVKPALGIYPNDAVAMKEDAFLDELDFIKASNPVAIGEVGLDYHHDDSKKKEMQAVFHQFITLAEKMHKPMIIHSRKAEADVIELITSSKVVADLHCFGGSLKLAKKAADFDCYFSIPPTIGKSTHFQRLVEELPLSSLLTETDSPWLSPDENKNEPANIPLVVKKIAEIKKMTEEETANQLWFNAQKFLR